MIETATLFRGQEGKPYVTCDQSGDDVAISSLLTGFKPETPAGVLAVRAERRRLFTAMREQMEKTCPSVFTLVPSRDFKLLETWMESVTRAEEAGEKLPEAVRSPAGKLAGALGERTEIIVELETRH